jgi:hypothetical protein
LAALLAVPAAAQLAVRGETVHTMAGAPIRDGVVLVGKNGKIERVGRAGDVPIPGGDARRAGRAAEGKSPGTRPKMVALLRAELIKAREYLDKKGAAEKGKEPEPNALRIADEFKIKVVLDGEAEAQAVLDPIRKAGVGVIVHPTMARHGGEMENASFETASVLKQAGVPVALQTGFEGYVPKVRVLLFEAAAAAANGLGMEDALAASTIDPAKILGIADRVGSLEAGKDGGKSAKPPDRTRFGTSSIERIERFGWLCFGVGPEPPRAAAARARSCGLPPLFRAARRVTLPAAVPVAAAVAAPVAAPMPGAAALASAAGPALIPRHPRAVAPAGASDHALSRRDTGAALERRPVVIERGHPIVVEGPLHVIRERPRCEQAIVEGHVLRLERDGRGAGLPDGGVGGDIPDRGRGHGEPTRLQQVVEEGRVPALRANHVRERAHVAVVLQHPGVDRFAPQLVTEGLFDRGLHGVAEGGGLLDRARRRRGEARVRRGRLGTTARRCEDEGGGERWNRQDLRRTGHRQPPPRRDSTLRASRGPSSTRRKSRSCWEIEERGRPAGPPGRPGRRERSTIRSSPGRRPSLSRRPRRPPPRPPRGPA